MIGETPKQTPTIWSEDGTPIPPRTQGTWSRIVDILLPLIVAAVVSYVTAVTALQKQTAVLEERQTQQYGEVIRSLDLIREDIRELRRDTRGRP